MYKRLDYEAEVAEQMTRERETQQNIVRGEHHIIIVVSVFVVNIRVRDSALLSNYDRLKL